MVIILGAVLGVLKIGIISYCDLIFGGPPVYETPVYLKMLAGSAGSSIQACDTITPYSERGSDQGS